MKQNSFLLGHANAAAVAIAIAIAVAVNSMLTVIQAPATHAQQVNGPS